MQPEPLTAAEVLELSKLSKRKNRNITQSLRYNSLTNKKNRHDRLVQSQSPKTQQQQEQFDRDDENRIDEDRDKPRKTRDFVSANLLEVS